MSHNIRELERKLLQETGKRLAQLGFSSILKEQIFLRAITNGRVAMHLSFIEHETDVDVTIDVAIRFDAVEDMVHRSNKLLSPKEKSQTFTLGAELGNLEHGEPFRLTLIDNDDVPDVAEDIVTKFKLVGLPYIERYSNLEAAYDVLSRDDREAWMHSPIHAERAKRACALLVAMRRPTEVPDLAAQKQAFLQSVNDPGAAAFAKFVTELQLS